MMKNEVYVEDSWKELKIWYLELEIWYLEFPEQASVSMYYLRNNASRFKKEPEIRKLILVRNRNEIGRQEDRVYEDTSNHQIIFKYEAESDSTQNDRYMKQMNWLMKMIIKKDLRTVIGTEDK